MFFFNDTATTEIYTLSLHDALPIYRAPRGPVPDGEDAHRAGQVPEQLLDVRRRHPHAEPGEPGAVQQPGRDGVRDRKSTRLNSSHANISYAVFCLKKKNKFNSCHHL